MDLNDLLSRAWKTAWTHKALWGFGAIGMAIGILSLPLALAPLLSLSDPNEFPIWIENPAYMIGWLAVFLVLLLVSFLASPWLQAGLSLGALRAAQGEQRLNFGVLISAARPYYLRFLGLMAIVVGGMLLVNFAISFLTSALSLLTMGLASLCLTPITILLIPVMYAAMAWMELAMAAVVVRDLRVMDALRHAWQLILANKLPVLLLILVMYLGIGIVSMLFILPVMLPSMVAPMMIVSEAEPPRALLIVAGVCAAAYLPVLAVFQGLALAFSKSGWLVGYLQMTRPAEENTPIQANA